jgi:hypothetical protein
MILTAAEARIALGLASSVTDADRAMIELLLPMVTGAVKKHLQYDPEYRQHVEYYPRAEIAPRSGSGGTWDSNGSVAYFQPTERGILLQLQHLPVRSILEIRADWNGGFGQKASTFGSDTILVAGTDYFQDQLQEGVNATGHVFSYTAWPSEPGTVKVTYKAGYSDWELAGRAFNTDETDPDTETTCSGLDASPIKQAAMLTMVQAFNSFKFQSSGRGADGGVSGVLTGERMGDYSYTVDLSAFTSAFQSSMALPAAAQDYLEEFRHYGLMLL